MKDERYTMKMKMKIYNDNIQKGTDDDKYALEFGNCTRYTTMLIAVTWNIW